MTFEGIDLLEVRNGLIARNDAVADTLSIARQLGLVPPGGSTAEQRLFSAFNAKTRVERRAVAKRELERVADGVWVLRGGVPRTMNVYLLEDEGGGVTLFDAGIRSMTHALAAAAAPLGGINRIVLGHADADHRGAAPGLRVPVFCHPADREAAASASPLREYHRLGRLGIPARYVYRQLMAFWDGGPVEIDGHGGRGRRGQWLSRRAPARPRAGPDRAVARERPARADQRLLLRDRPETSLRKPPGPPHEAFNQDTEQARASMRKLAALDPAAAWPGHADPVMGDVRGQLERAAAAVMARKKLKAPTSEYRSPDGDVLVLRGSMTSGRRGASTPTRWAARRSRARTLGTAASSSCSSAWRSRGRSRGPMP